MEIKADGTADGECAVCTKNIPWTCSGNVFRFTAWGGANLTLSADGKQMSGTSGIYNSPTTAIRKSAPPAAAIAETNPTTGKQPGQGAGSTTSFRVAATPEEAAQLLAFPENAAPRGVYKLDRDYDFNVLDAVSYDAATRQISLAGHRDARFNGPRIPYLQHLAVLLEVAKPEFTLTTTPDSDKRVAAFFNSSLSPQQRNRITAQLTDYFDRNGNVNQVGRYMLPAMGIYPVAGNKPPGYLGVDTQYANGSCAVIRVAPGSPAAQAGLAVGDVINRINEKRTLFPEELIRIVRAAGVGSTVKVEYLNAQGFHQTDVTLTADANSDPWSGVIRADMLAGLFRAAGKEDAARFIYAIGVNEMYGGKFTNLPNIFQAMNLGHEARVAQTSGSVAQQKAFARQAAQRIDEIFEFAGNPILAASDAAVARTNDPGQGLEAAFEQIKVAIRPKLGALIDQAFDRPGGVQIPPELMDGLFHVRPEMVPDYLDIPPNTLLARAMLDGDYLAKRMINRPDLKFKIPNYQTKYEFDRNNPQFHRSEADYHLWISVKAMDTAQSADGDTLQFRNVKMRFNIRERNAARVDLPNQLGGYEELLTSLYDDFAQEYPTLHELHEVAKLAAAADWLRSKSPAIHMPKEGAVAWNGPAKLPGLMFAYLNRRGDVIIPTLVSMGGVSLVPFPPGAPHIIPTDANIVDLRGLAAGGPMPTGAPLTPIDSSIVDLRDMPAGGPPSAAAQDVSFLVAKPINIAVPPPVGWVKTGTTGKDSYQQITVSLNAISAADAERALAQRDALDKARDIALQLWVIERALDILKQGNPDWAQQLGALQKDLAGTTLPLQLLTGANIQSLANSPAALDSLRTALAGQQKQVAGELNAALADPLLKSAAAPGAAGRQTPSARSGPCAVDGTFCTNDKVAMPGLGPTVAGGTQTAYSSTSAQLKAMAADTKEIAADPRKIDSNAGCIFAGQSNCTTAAPMNFPKPEPHSQAFNELAARITANSKLAGDSGFQDRLAWYRHLDGQLEETKTNLAAIQQQLDSGKGDAEILAVKKHTLENSIEQTRADIVVAKKMMDDQAKTLNMSVDWPGEAPAPDASGGGVPPPPAAPGGGESTQGAAGGQQ